MKKTVLILIGLAVVSLKSEAQHFIASFGVEHRWTVPLHVSEVIHSDYHGYSWVHASQVRRGGNVFFDLVLQRGDVFIEVSVSNDGYIHRRVRRDHYPLHNHVCNNYCGYHNSYYNTYYKVCHSHHHHGHNHVVYINKPRNHNHGHYDNKTYIYKSKDYRHTVYDKHNYKRGRDHHYRRESNYDRERRDRYFVSKDHEKGRGKDKYERKERSKGHGRKPRDVSYASRRR